MSGLRLLLSVKRNLSRGFYLKNPVIMKNTRCKIMTGQHDATPINFKT